MDKEGTTQGLKFMIKTAAECARAGEGMMILSCEANGFSHEQIDPILRSAPFPVFGGVFPGVVFGQKLYTQGTVAVLLPLAFPSGYIGGFSDDTVRFEAALEEMFRDAPLGPTIMVFVDGFSLRLGPFIEGLFNVFGLESNYIGGGAGSLRKCRKPCLFTNEGMRSDGAVISMLTCSSGVGVSHGWKELAGPYQVTEARHNLIKTLNWRPALEVYLEAITPHYGQMINTDDFFDISKAYPFGISRLGAEEIVRDPIWVAADGSLMCPGETPEGAFINILHGDADSVIQASGVASDRACAAFRGAGTQFLMDCISRVLFLEDRYQEELGIVSRGNMPLVGACTIGEIANSGVDYLEFYNKTSVVAVVDVS